MTNEIPSPRRPSSLETGQKTKSPNLQELLDEFCKDSTLKNEIPNNACLGFNDRLVAMAGIPYVLVLIPDGPYTIVSVVAKPGEPQYAVQIDEGKSGITHKKLTLRAKTFRFIVNYDYPNTEELEEAQNTLSLREAHFGCQVGTNRNFNQNIDNVTRKEIAFGDLSLLDGLPAIVRQQVLSLVNEIVSKIGNLGAGAMVSELVK